MQQASIERQKPHIKHNIHTQISQSSYRRQKVRIRASIKMLIKSVVSRAAFSKDTSLGHVGDFGGKQSSETKNRRSITFLIPKQLLRALTPLAYEAVQHSGDLFDSGMRLMHPKAKVIQQSHRKQGKQTLRPITSNVPMKVCMIDSAHLGYPHDYSPCTLDSALEHPTKSAV